MDNCFYILTGQAGELIAYSEEATLIFSGMTDGAPVASLLEPLEAPAEGSSRAAVSNILRPLTRTDAAGAGPFLPTSGYVSVGERTYKVSAYCLHPGYTLYSFKSFAARAEESKGTLTISCAEITHKLRNPLTSMKLVTDMLPLYLPEGTFKEKALEVLNKQIKRLETYALQLETRAGGGSCE